ncbi:MAG: glycosyltransferase family 2 protein [Pyrinomonadaceae bacterium]|nr:glycosyltransferase family 2 protein [Pyrinomonadaceae bacterium]
MSPELSVITCSHNPRPDYLRQVLDALKRQTLDQQHWEYLLIDNASDSPLESGVDLSWHPNARHVREEKLGLTHARLRGISESTGEVLVFVDDDNVLDADFLEQVARVADEWPRLGVWGGQTRAGFEEPPPDWTRQYWSRLALREFDQDRWSNLPTAHETMPNGAGLCVRKVVGEYYAEAHASGQREVLMDRVGNSLVSGGDSDIAICACDLGLGMGLFTSLKLTHLIPADRLTEEYLVRLVEGLAYSTLVLNSFRPSNGSTPPRNWATSAADFARLLIRDRRERRFFRAVRKGERKAAELLARRG